MAAALSPSLQQQLAEVEAEAQRLCCPPLTHAAATGRHGVLAHLLHAPSSGDDNGQGSRATALQLAAFTHGKDFFGHPPVPLERVTRESLGNGLLGDISR
jgi:hypothetical protein